MSISGLEFLSDKKPEVPLLIYANHTSWWDGLLAFEISRAAHLDSYMMMEEINLRRLFMFRWLGAFSVKRNARSSIESINYAAKLLQENSKRTVWIFPQGEINHNDFRPLRFFNGAARIVEKVDGCSFVALAFRLEFTGQYKPEIFVKIAKPEKIEVNETFNSKKLTQRFSENTVKLLDELRVNVINKEIGHFLKLF